MALNDYITMNNELEEWEGDGHGLILTSYLDVFLEERRKTTKNLSQANLCRGRDSNRATAERKPEELPSEPKHSLLTADTVH
jgi:hypothetical protein